MPKSRNKNNASKTVGVTSTTAPVPLLDSICAQIQSSNKPKNDTASNVDSSQMSVAGWQCDIDDWSDKKTSNNEPDRFPQTLRALERKHEQTKNVLFPLSKTINNANEKKSEFKEQIDSQTKRSSSDNIDLTKLSLIVTDLITGKHDEPTYTDFLSILQRFSVLSSRDDHFEETVYHLIQAAVSFIRSNKHRFDPSRLEECYRQRYLLKRNSTQ